jgi:hypothetical protein
MARKQSISSEMIDKHLDEHFLDRVNEDDDSNILVTQGTPLQLRSPEKNDVPLQKESSIDTSEKITNATKKPINVYTNPANGPVNLRLDSGHHLNVTVSGASSDCEGSENSSSRLMDVQDSNNSSFRDNLNTNREKCTENEDNLEVKKDLSEGNGVLRQMGDMLVTDKSNEDTDSKTVIRSDVEDVSELDQKGDSRSCLLDNKDMSGAS